MSDLKLAIVKNNLWHDEDLPEDFCVDAYAAVGKHLKQYKDKKGRIRYKKRKYAGAGVGHAREKGIEAKLPNAGAGFEETEDGVKKGVAQAEVCSLSAADGNVKSSVGALKAGAGFEATDDSITAGAQAEVLRSSVSYGAVGVEAGLLKAEAGVKADEDGVTAKLKATLGEVSASAGPVKATVGVSAETGVGIGKDGVDVKFLGTGFKFGSEIGFSVLGSGFSFKLW